MLRIHEITTNDQFLDLQNNWNAVLGRSKDNNVFLTWQHMAISMKYLRKNQTPRILYVTKGNKIIGIAPLLETTHTLHNHVSYTVIEPLALENTDYSGFILAENEFECLQIILSYLFFKNDWDYFWIRNIPETSYMVNLLANSPNVFPKFEIKNGLICPYLSLPNSEEELLNSLSAKFRKNLKNSIKNLKRDFGKIQFKEYTEFCSLEQAMEILFDLHQRRWVAKGEPGMFGKRSQRNVATDEAKHFAEKNWVKLYFLMVESKPVAAKYCINYNGKIYDRFGGWDPKYSTYSIGNVLLLKIMEKCIEEQIEEYDFMQGAELYKFNWSGKFRRNLHLKFVNRRLSSHLIRFGVEATKKTSIEKIFRKLLSV